MNPEPASTVKLPAELLEPWWAFTAKPGDRTANAVANALKALHDRSPDDAVKATRVIAEDLARRSIQDRSLMSLLLTFWLIDTTTFLQATAAVRIAYPTMTGPAPDRTAEHLDPARAQGWQPPEPVSAEAPASPKPGELDEELLAGLDLAAAGGRVVDVVELARRVDDATDATSIRHLEETLNLLTSIVTGRGYSAARRADLASTIGTAQEHMADQMGFRAAPTNPAGRATQALTALDAQNNAAVQYWRTDFRARLEEFVAKLPPPDRPGKGQVLVNSPTVLRKLGVILPPRALTGLTIQPLRGDTGISMLSGLKLDDDTVDEPVVTDQILNEMGATPSAYQLYDLLDEGKPEAPTESWIDTHAALARLLTSSRFARLQEFAAGRSGMAPVCAMIEKLVRALTDREGPARHDALTAGAIVSLANLIDIVVASVDAPAVALRAIDLMMDEIGIIVAVAKNYRWADYRETMHTILLERAPSLRGRTDIDVDPHLVSSGMDALVTALTIALGTRGHQDVTRTTEPVDYFETDLLLNKMKKGERLAPRKDVLVAALNPSTPFTAPNAGRLVADVLAELSLAERRPDDPPFALIIDTTIQTAPGLDAPSELDVVLGGLADAIATGELEVFLCKSFQKYATFGFGKVAAGDLTLLSQKDGLASASARVEVLREEFALDLTRHDEAQLVIHMLRHGHQHELALIAAAAANARFVDTFCWPTGGVQALGSSYVDGIPLLLRATPNGDINTPLKRFLALDPRSSFSFLRTSYVGNIDLPKGVDGATVRFVRFNTGHESRAAMVELFYAMGHLALGLLPGATSPVATAQVNLDSLTMADVNSHLRALVTASLLESSGKPDLERYQNNIVASYCLCASHLVRGQQDAKITLLVSFFNENLVDITPDTLHALAEALLKLFETKPVGDDPTQLSALSRAATILPAWRFPARTNLTGIGGSEPARRLKALVDRARKVNAAKQRK